MPSHTPASALIKFLHAVEGAPWIYPRWQEITGIHHGINPPDDSKLPPGWTRRDAEAVISYVMQYQALKTEDAKIKFASTRKQNGHDPIPGRSFLREWVTRLYAPVWKVHTRISQVLSDANIHPLQIMIANGELTTWPNGSSYLPLALDKIGLELFGMEALGPTGLLHMSLRDPTQILAQRTWITLKRSVTSKIKKLGKLEKEAEDAVAALDDATLTVGQVGKALRTVGKLKSHVETCSTAAIAAKTESMHKVLSELMEDLKDSTKSKGKTKSKTVTKLKSSANPVVDLATADEVSELLEVYDQYFCPAANAPIDLETNNTIGMVFGEPVAGADPGVEVECNMSADRLAFNLGFKNNVPFLFNNHRHIAGSTPWDCDFEEIGKQDPSLLESFSLHWHQLAGVHAVVRKIFTVQPTPSHCTGMLIADDVGLGKTLQAATVVAFLADLAIRQERNLILPPLIAAYPYLKGHFKVPSKPHLLIVPPTLLDQWVLELKAFFKPKMIDILLYGVGISAHEAFWKPNGPYYSSNHSASHRIIVAAESALAQDFGLLYSGNRGNKSLPWDLPDPLPAYQSHIQSTLFHLEYASVIIDEAQALRNPGAKHSSALRVLEQGLVRLILTATPLQTSTRDISAMGRLVGIESFASNDAFLEQRADEAALRRARQERSEDGDPTDEDDPVRILQVEISRRMQAQFDSRVIRRTAESLNPDKQQLIRLPKLSIIHGVVTPSRREMDIIEKFTYDGLEDASAANGRNISSNMFYLDHRKSVTYARVDIDDPIPKFSTLKEWEAKKSTKIDFAVKIVKHILSHDNIPPVTFKDGTVVFPDAPSSPNPAPQETKILVYQEFVSFAPLLRNIFELHGIKVLSISGRTTPDSRAQIIRKFNNDPSSRVLLFSKVGSVGLNLTRASIVIFVDQPWSAQDERQIIGRAYRQRQERPVTVIHLLAANTADITLSLLARGKKDMLDAFLNQDQSDAAGQELNLQTDLSKQLTRVLLGNMLTNPEDDNASDTKEDGEDPNPGPKPTKRNSRKKGRKTKSSRLVVDDEDKEAEATSVAILQELPSAVFDDSVTTDGDTDMSLHGLSSLQSETSGQPSPAISESGDSFLPFIPPPAASYLAPPTSPSKFLQEADHDYVKEPLVSYDSSPIPPMGQLDDESDVLNGCLPHDEPKDALPEVTRHDLSTKVITENARLLITKTRESKKRARSSESPEAQQQSRVFISSTKPDKPIVHAMAEGKASEPSKTFRFPPRRIGPSDSGRNPRPPPSEQSERSKGKIPAIFRANAEASSSKKTLDDPPNRITPVIPLGRRPSAFSTQGSLPATIQPRTNPGSAYRRIQKKILAKESEEAKQRK